MEAMINLTDLLKYEILDLYSAEEQIIEAMPAMIENAKNPELKKALREHLKITEVQKNRLDKVKELMGEGNGEKNQDGEKKGFFSRLFGGGSGGEKCKGMEGLITEGKKIIGADITDEALDAAIIASAQKIEHYEICGYGTSRAYARELKLMEVEQLLSATLKEEYTADDMLTALAVGKLNMKAEEANEMGNEIGKSGHSNKTGTGNSKGASKGSSKSSAKGVLSKGSSKSSSKGVSSKGSSKSSSSKGGSKSNSKGSSNSSRGGSSKSGNKGSASKGSKSSSKGNSKKG